MKLFFAAFLALTFSTFTLAARQELSKEDKAEVLKVLEKNDLLFNAFLKEDNDLIQKRARELEETLSSTKSPVLKEARKEAGKLKKIKSGDDKDMEAYEAVSNPLVAVVKKYDVGSNYNVFSCPMVKKSWIQDVRVNKGIKNVYAMYMLECGTQDTKF